MTTIDPRTQLAGALQAQLAAVRERAQAGPAAEAKSPAKGAAASSQAAASAMLQRLQAIARDDPERRRKAVRLFLESEFAREFGGELLNDPAFPQMLDAVQEQMQADAQTAAAVDALGDLLLAK